MLRSKGILGLVAITALIVGVVGISSNAKAVETGVRTQEAINGTTTTSTQQTTARSIAKLEASKLQLCKTRETEINNILSRISDRGTKQADVFDKIATRVKSFYVTKAKPLNNYEALVAQVDATKATVQSAVQKLSYSHITFSCDGDNPRSVISTFKENLLALNSALKDYRTAIKELIVGVKSVQGTTTSSANSNTTSGSQQ